MLNSKSNGGLAVLLRQSAENGALFKNTAGVDESILNI